MGKEQACPEVMRCQTAKSQQALCGAYQRQQTVSLCQSMHVHMGRAVRLTTQTVAVNHQVFQVRQICQAIWQSPYAASHRHE